LSSNGGRRKARGHGRHAGAHAAGLARAAIRACRRRSPIRALRDWLDHLAARERLVVIRPNVRADRS
jgi:hypothetical protein